MIHIERIRIRLPRAMQDNARTFVDALATALVQTPVSRDVRIESISLPPISVAAGLDVEATAALVAARVRHALNGVES